MQIRPPRPTDGMEIAAIHAEGLATGHASFRDDPMDWDAFADSFAQALIAEDGGMVLGFAGVSATSARPVYAGVGEVSTYVSLRAQRRGVGRALLSALIAES
ncbi:MAG: GNAT family N-acetyltransferase, partial [Pseudomonadota bacterium]